MPLAGRILGVVGEPPRDTRASGLAAIRTFLLCFGAARTWVWLFLAEGLLPEAGVLVTAVILTGCAVVSLRPGVAHWGPRVALPALLLQLAWTLPYTDNHFFIELVAVGLLTLAGPKPTDGGVVSQGLQLATLAVLFHTGLQKVLYGLYFRGEFLAYMIAQGGRFADGFLPLLPADEVAQFASYDVMRMGNGPFRGGPVLMVVSNAVYLVEMLLVPALLARRTRAVAAGIALAFVLAIQVGAREFGFALLFGNLLLLFLPGTPGRWLTPLQVAFLCWVVGAACGVLPGRSLISLEYL